MSLGVSIFIIALVVLMIVGSLWLLLATSRDDPAQPLGNAPKDHVWDGDLRELNNPLPRWWLWLFILTIVFSIAYLIAYPGFGSYGGMLGWSQQSQYEAQVADAEQKLSSLYAQFSGRSVSELSQDPEAQRVGASLFAQHCAACHGSDARGAIGFPNLTDDEWQWGSSDQQILASIVEGRQAAMPAWASVLGERGVTETVVYVQQLSGGRVDPAMAAAGKKHYETLCFSCHAMDGTGNAALGAPDLTNDIWLYGGNVDALKVSLMVGRSGAMPAFGDLLGEEKSRVLAAYVRALSQ